MTKPDTRASIMIVDDEPANLKILEAILTAAGYRTRALPLGRLALNAVEKDPPDLILLDINMPEMDGYEVLKRLKDSHLTAKIPIIFVTAKTEEEDEQKGLELGAVDYITKPISPAITLARIKNHLELRHMRANLEDLVLKCTRQLRWKVAELEARDRLVRFQLQSLDPQAAGREILKEIASIFSAESLCLLSPIENSSSAELRIFCEQSSDADAADDLKTDGALKLATESFKTQKVKAAGDKLMAAPILFRDEVLGVILLKIGAEVVELQKDMAETLWRMAAEAGLVLRMANMTEELNSDSVDFDALMDLAEKSL